MFRTAARRLLLKFVAITLLTFGVYLTTKDPTKALLASRQVREKLPATAIAPQADAPLRIVNTFIESEPGIIRVRIMAQNQSQKIIRAYSILADAGAYSRVDFANLTNRAAVIKPTQVKTVGVSFNETEPPESITLSVDFVEFEDGSTWGPDSQHSRDRLAGQREGAKAERRRLHELLKAKGPSAVFDAVREDVPDVLPADAAAKHSKEWVQGYHNGVGSLRHRLRRSLPVNDSARAESELAQPFDLSEEQP